MWPSTHCHDSQLPFKPWVLSDASGLCWNHVLHPVGPGLCLAASSEELLGVPQRNLVLEQRSVASALTCYLLIIITLSFLPVILSCLILRLLIPKVCGLWFNALGGKGKFLVMRGWTNYLSVTCFRKWGKLIPTLGEMGRVH